MKKNPFLPFFICVLLFACHSNQEVNHAEPGASPPIDDFRKFDTAISFTGFWVNEKYIESLIKTKSPSRADVPENSCFTIPARTLQGTDEVLVIARGAAYRIHPDQTRPIAVLGLDADLALTVMRPTG